MKVTIRKRGSKTAILISFDTNNEKFKSASEKTKFFEELYGRRQVIRREKKVYHYEREGAIPRRHIKVDNSVFIIMQEHMKRMEEFMQEWEDKVMFKTFPVLLDKDDIKKLKENEIRGEE